MRANASSTATSYGGSRTASVTVKRDATAPDVTCEPSSDAIWPPNHRLVPIDVAVTVTDSTSGAAEFTLTSASGGGSDDLVGFDLGMPDVSGWARAERAGNGSDREYVLAYTGRDAAGNTRRCAVHILVPHDQDGQKTS